MKRLACLIAIISLAAACEKKKYPESVVHGAAEFYFRGDVDGGSVNLEAGRNNYYMYSSYQASDSLPLYIGNLRKKDCLNCPSALEVILHNDRFVRSGEPVFTSTSINIGEKIFWSGQAFEVGFHAKFNRDATSYEWDFGDGSTGTGENISHRYSTPGKYNVCLVIRSSNGCVSQVCNTQDISANGLLSFVRSEPVTDNTLNFSSLTTGAAQPTFHWNFGDGTQSNHPAPVHTYLVPGSYPVVLSVNDGQGRTITTTYNALTGDDESSCAANYEITGVKQVADEWRSRIEIRWTDGSGRLFTSAKAVQDAGSKFEVISVEDHKTNERNEPVKKISIRFDCTLSDGTDTISITGAEAVIAVSYPK